jgi:hypothetical protein
MYGLTRGALTLLGAAIAGFLIWLATQFELDGDGGEYWAAMGLLAAAGLTMALSQLFGGWTKWGVPRVSAAVFLLGFLPALIVGGWVLLAAMPAQDFNTSNWSRDLGIDGGVDDLAEFVGVIAFGLGLIFGFTFDTSGPRVRRDVVDERERAAAGAAPADDRYATRRPTAGEDVREAPVERAREPEPEPAPRTGPPPAGEDVREAPGERAREPEPEPEPRRGPPAAER